MMTTQKESFDFPQDGMMIPSLTQKFSNEASEDITTPLIINGITSPNHQQLKKKLKTLRITLDSVLDSTPQEIMRVIFSMEDAIRGESSEYQTALTLSPSTSRIIVAISKYKDQYLIVLAIDVHHWFGLLLEISKCLTHLKLELCHTEAAVRDDCSLSIWYC